MAVENNTPAFFTGVEDSGIISRTFAGGTLCLCTIRDPYKETSNEDSAAILVCDEGSGVLVVADGVGGMPGGDKASATAVTSLADAVSSGCREGVTLRESILDGIEHANRSVLETSSGAGTTVTAVEINNGSIRSFHIGDSIALLVGQKGKIKHQTIPHSPIGYAIESGLMLEDDAMTHDERHIISNIVGSSEMRMEIGPLLTLAKRDTLILGSDGLFDNLMLDEIINIIRCGPLTRCAEQLVTICQERMRQPGSHELHKPDDMTFILYRPNPL